MKREEEIACLGLKEVVRGELSKSSSTGRGSVAPPATAVTLCFDNKPELFLVLLSVVYLGSQLLLLLLLRLSVLLLRCTCSSPIISLGFFLRFFSFFV